MINGLKHHFFKYRAIIEINYFVYEHPLSDFYGRQLNGNGVDIKFTHIYTVHDVRHTNYDVK